ncbi:NAD(P)-dependent oxidoreductase [SAR202 cluster bacterium AC-409-J13_OGT_754m]|nr:NAD(P)-dependent oxidoreductase [SAR202 cluster bacterium AC-409-J13_OGT_754m]
MTILVTGGNGFVGSNIVRQLALEGHNVLSMDLHPPDALVQKYLSPWSNKITFLVGDIVDSETLTAIASSNQIENIIHAAVYTAVTEELERTDSRRIIDINLIGTTNLLDLASRVKVKRFVYVSSGGVYEGSTQSRNEETPVAPRQVYNITKYASELLTERYSILHGFQSSSVRLGGPYGPMERVTSKRSVMSILHEWTGKAIRNEPIEIPERNQWDFTYVHDIAGGICKVLNAKHLPNNLYNLTSGNTTSLEKLINTFQQVYPGVQFIGAMPTQEPNPVDPPRTSMDSSRIKKDLGFSPEYDIFKGLSSYFKWREEYNYTE